MITMKAAPNGRCNPGPRSGVVLQDPLDHRDGESLSEHRRRPMSHRVLAIARARLAWHRHDGPLAKEAAGHYAMMAEFPVSGRDWPR